MNPEVENTLMKFFHGYNWILFGLVIILILYGLLKKKSKN